MSFASDLSAVTKDTAGGIQAISGRTRVQGIYYVASATAGSIKLYDGTANTDPLVVELATPDDEGANDILLPDAGILFKEGVFLDFDEATSVTLFFYGGAVAPDPPPPPPP
jgi:hypothetical protein